MKYMMTMMSIRTLGAELGGGIRTRCQDCGNKAKKNCMHMRCRTCCKRRGFECETHIKSTWNPAYKRLHHHLQEQQLQGQNPKRLIENDNNNYDPCSSLGLQMGTFPAEIKSEATFRCVKVSSIIDESGIDQTLAYQTAISVGGHVFKGILYYHGPESCSINVGQSSSTEPPLPPQPYYPFNVAALTTTTTATTAAAAAAADQTLHPSSYTFTFGSYMSPGTQFFPQYPKS